MTLKTTRLRDAITFAIATGATALAGTGIAYAQDATDQTTTLDRIEVTGSRIKRTEVETSQPVFTLSREEIQAQGLTSVGDVIQNLSANGSALNSTFNNGGNGETRVSLRNLGSARTLVLVNGRRWVGGTGLGGAVDLNTIPTAAVERIEVLKAGASSIYGSDAIAGVVNLILRTDFQGAEGNAFLGGYDKGDGFRESYDLTIGTSDDRFTAMFGVGYVKEEPVMAGDRPESAEPYYKTGNLLGSSTTPNGRFAICTGVINPISGACSVTETRPNGTGGQFTYDPGQSGTNWRNYAGTDAYNFAPLNYLVTPQERKSIFGRASLALTDNTSAFVTATYNNRRSEQLLAAMPIVLGTGPGAGVQARTVSISEFSLYNPFGEPVSRIQRRANETGGRSFAQNVDTFGFNGGLEGSLERWGKFITWDAGFNYARNDQNDTTNGLFNIPALRQALGPSELRNGIPVCVTAPGGAVIAGCVPMNLLGAQGSITPEMLAFSSFVAHDEFGYKMKQYYVNGSMELFDLQGGTVAIAAGLEHREESGFDQPDALINSGNTTGNARTATNGAYKVDEAYVELAIPVLSDLPFADLLEFNLASRVSDYSNFGDTVNSSFGFKWQPIEDLLVRGNWAQGFRGPSIAELFQGVSDSFPSISDPCSTTFGGVYNQLTPEQQARCHAQGVPVGGYDQGNTQIRISVGGNTELMPETSVTKTLGMVWNPGMIEGFDVSLDWWKIDLENTITSFSGQFILDQCIEEGISAFCNYTRSAGGNIDTLLSGGLNVGAAEVEGWDLTLNYRMPETAWGKFSFTWDTTYMSSFKTDNDADGDIDQDDGGSVVGEYFDRDNNWRIRSNLMTRWEMGDMGATLFTRYYSRQEEDCPFYYNDYGFGELCNDAITDVDGINQAGSQNQIGSRIYHDATVYWNAPWNAKITLGVNNLADKTPPLAYTAFANSFDPQYEIGGRFFYLQYNQRF
ncbi:MULTISPECIES: TonB-dependent receptor [unclassified Luteimonas]|uniref:TonB-dependent receptor plug domain-containing protein n=1 Tax=unclassified Luteimonas TaxID=2629088 RepID=UPI0018F0D120|nr:MULTISPECIES: TonB-dependent receptor [unclassified Luteimonas]MBJ6982454.1 TonB-dependent receptor [Luteimonas sp. MC1572]MBJ7574968.1 TonB-dependent receptor [Luteimonas sp. MC1828]QQO03714.1 TonB-dependent receptor [Luteimonas sp. MC1572]